MKSTSSHIKFIKLAKKPHIYCVFSAFLVLSIVSSLCSIVVSQPLILTNGQPTLEGLDAGMHIDSPTRKKIDLAGTWQYSISGDIWRDIKVPSSIAYEGQVTLHRTFAVSEELLKKSAFKFVALGINYECEIFINDVFIGKHVGGYTSFEFDVPDDVLQIGQENTIKVMVSNRLSARKTLPVWKQIWGWKNYGGILRDVYILATPRLWVDHVRFQTSSNIQMNQATVRLECVLSNKQFGPLNRDSLSSRSKQSSYFLNVELHERFSDLLIAQGTSAPITLESNKNANVQLALTVNGPKLWSPENPELYILKTSVVAIEGKQRVAVDQYNLNMGFTSVQVQENAFILNSNKIKLKGVVWMEDSPRWGASLSYEQMEKDVVLIKALGANAVRFAFHPPHPYMLNLCSRYGLLVIEEMPVWNVPAEILNEEAFQSMAEIQTREMVERDGGYPCVLAWGIGNQFDSADEQALGFVKKISEVIHQLDDRPVYYGSPMLKNDVCTSGVDFVGITLPQCDLKTFRRLLSEWERNHPSQPLVVLSYGKEVEQNNRNGYSDPMSQEAQARFFIQYYAALKEANTAGSFVLALTDWRGDRPLLNFGLGDRYLHPVGLLSQSREKRLAYEVVRVLYNEERITAIPAGNHRMNFPWVHVLIGFLVIVLIGYEYTNRRFGESLQRSLIRSYNFFVDLRDLHTVSIGHTLILSGAISTTLACLLSGIMYHYRADRFADYIITYLCTMDYVKEQFIRATWHPFAGIVVLTCLFFLAGAILALLMWVLALFIRIQVSWVHVYSVSVWGAAPIIFLSPLAMSLFKIMENPSYVLPSLVLIGLFLFWTLLRVLKGVSVMYDLSPVKTYVGGFLMCIILLGGLFLYYDSIFALSSYLKFIIHLAQNLG
ncbi:MAG: beta galactosidase jelly roll domain-containing protein [Ignavibacteriales bacterium]|nr:beta galactosidase jelly roll domain-containing protein [Ignavibacteriales bacterium]